MTAARDNPLPGWPRGMREDIAAEYVGLSPATLRSQVAATRLTPGRIVYLKEDLDAYLDRKAGRSPTFSQDGREWMEA